MKRHVSFSNVEFSLLLQKENRKAYVLSNGCPENAFDAARVKLYLKENGWNILNNPEDADLVLFNACGLMQRCVQDSIEAIRTLEKTVKPSAQIIVWGCLTKIDPGALSEVYGGPVFGEAELETLDGIINARKSIMTVTCNEVMHSHQRIGRGVWPNIFHLPERLFAWFYYDQNYWGRVVELYKPEDPSIFYIKIATGCAQHCSYCVACNSRGRIKSKPINKVVDEFKEGIRQGFVTFSLLGTDLGSYGKDQGCNLTDLLKEMIKQDGQYKIGLRNVYPGALKKMLDGLKPILSTGKIWYMEIPAESGSDRILSLMRRGYTTDDLKECVRSVKRAWPDLFIRTQFITGFPTETGKDFAQSMRLLDDLGFDFVEVYQFSRMPGTLADKMQQTPGFIAKYRMYRMMTKAMGRSMLRKKAYSTSRTTSIQ